MILDDIRAECARNGGDTNADAEEISERLKKRGETISPATVKFHIRALLEAKQVVRAAKRKGADGRWTRERLSVPEHPYKATEVLEEAAEIAKRHAEYVGDPEERQRRRERYRRSKGLPESEVTRRVAEPRVSPLTVEELLAADPRGDGPLR